FAVSAFFHVVLLSLLPSRTSFFNCPVYGGQVSVRVDILEFFFFLKMACLEASSEFHLKNLCASAPLRENF
ncbi:MAG: hypothetical protein ORN23_07315, partial [Chthoniobacterales bacterium]|nr:hypothetical protein [Chthoniobacterales bacterium]